MPRRPDSRAYWDRAAAERPAWYISTGHEEMSDDFFRQGREEVDAFLRHTAVQITRQDRVLEIGCGAGRMSRRLAELGGELLALDVSPRMLELARQNLAGATNVEFVLGSGRDLEPLPDDSVDVVFSYVTLQHVPTRAAQLGYLRETCRVLRPGGRAALQVRAPGARATLLDLAGQLGRAARGRRTLRREWRGARLRRREILDAVRVPGVQVELTPHGPRHLWVVLRRAAGTG